MSGLYPNRFVCHLQMVVCPDSREHQYESLTSPFYQTLKRTYEHFSGGVSFHDAETIKISQVTDLARAWINREPVKLNFDPESACSGRLHEWSNRFFVAVDGLLGGEAADLRARRGNVHRGLQAVFERWQREKKTFKEVFAAEKASFGQTLARMYAEDQRKLTQMSVTMMRGLLPSLEDLLPPPAWNFMKNLQFVFQTEIGDEGGDKVLAQFFESGAINEAPFNVIGAAMYASLAMKAASGQKEIPNQGTATDIKIISMLLPYCDAMFVDNKTRALLQDIPREFSLPYPCKVFSPKTNADFICYLDEIKKSVTPGQLRLIEEVYGPDPMKAQSGIFGVGKRKRLSSSD